ncbi:sigma-54-dependent transcriptional regulator [Bacteroidota bacterium]
MKKTEAKILVIDDNKDVLTTAEVFLRQLYSYIRTENNPQLISNILAEEEFDIILLDMNFSQGKIDGSEGIHWLEQIMTIDPTIIVIVISAYGEINVAVKAIKAGAKDFVLKPWNNQKLSATINSALELKRTKEELKLSEDTRRTIDNDLNINYSKIIGNSYAIKKVFDIINKVSLTDADILISGNNGTGKELVAREIHRLSERKDKVFLTVDLGSISENLFESELFGHVKGAFTDAKEDKPGRFELASGGTLFLDEIGNLSLSLQSKLLSTLQNRKIIRVGSTKEINIDIRLICATNMDLYKLVVEKKFREDLLYRINTLEIVVPSLCDRIDDLPLLINYFLKRFSRKYKKPGLKISSVVLSGLKSYHWPGNIRELEHAVERAVILADGNNIDIEDFALKKQKFLSTTEDSLRLDEMEKTNIIKAIEKNKGHMTKAARELGIARTALYRRLKKYDIK